MTVHADTFVRLAESQAGDRYVYGAKQPASDPNPKAHNGAFDCSGLVTWAARRLGLTFPDGSQNQLDYCRQHATLIDVATAEHTRGALLFLGPDGSEHVVISRGDGTTIEARGAAYGIGEWSVYRNTWTAAARVPGLDYTTPAEPPPAPGQSAHLAHLAHLQHLLDTGHPLTAHQLHELHAAHQAGHVTLSPHQLHQLHELHNQ